MMVANSMRTILRIALTQCTSQVAVANDIPQGQRCKLAIGLVPKEVRTRWPHARLLRISARSDVPYVLLGSILGKVPRPVA